MSLSIQSISHSLIPIVTHIDSRLKDVAWLQGVNFSNTGDCHIVDAKSTNFTARVSIHDSALSLFTDLCLISAYCGKLSFAEFLVKSMYFGGTQVCTE